MAEELTTYDEFKQAIAAPQGAVIDYHAAWCGPCKLISPKFKTFSKTYGEHLKFYTCDVDALPDVAAEVGISSMPTFQFFRDGTKVDEMMGAVPAKLEEFIKKHAEVSKANITGAAPSADDAGASAS